MGAATGDTMEVDTITDKAGSGAPDAANGIKLSGGSDILDTYDEPTDIDLSSDALRGDFDDVTPFTKADFQFQMRDELGDVLWYIANIAEFLDLDLENVAQNNIAKLQSRKERNAIRGNGDNR